jgi:[ribosomal protein S5]-alanine N-acetyltransferase
MRKLSTERLVLEPLQESHAPELFRVLVDPIIYTFLHERPPFTEEELRARFRFLEKRLAPDGRSEWLSWAIRDHAGDGLGFLHAENYPEGVAGISVVLAPRAWRNGFAREAVAAVIRELAQQRGVAGFFATISPRNEPALRLFEKLGFRRAEGDGFDLREVDGDEAVHWLGRGDANRPA